MTRYGIAGVGYFGSTLARSLNTIEGAEITALYDPENGEAIASELQCRVEKSLESLTSCNDVDCVIVATPNHCHKEPVLLAARHGKHVFCEKPVALTYRDCDDMLRCCKENGVLFMAGHIMNFFNGIQHTKHLIKENIIGDILFCRAARTGWEDPQPSLSWKKMRSQSGGHLYHHIHELDCVQGMMGELPETVSMLAGNVAHRGNSFGDEDDMLFLNLEYRDGRFAVLEWGSAFRWSEHYVLIEGTKGAIRLDMHQCRGTLRVDDKDTFFLIHETQEEDDERTRESTGTTMDGAIRYGHPGQKTPLWLSSIVRKEMTYLHNVINGLKPDEEYSPLLTGEAARTTIAIADAARKSHTENRKVALSEILG